MYPQLTHSPQRRHSLGQAAPSSQVRGPGLSEGPQALWKAASDPGMRGARGHQDGKVSPPLHTEGADSRAEEGKGAASPLHCHS